MNRRGFIGSILALGAAPAIVSTARNALVFHPDSFSLVTPLWVEGDVFTITGVRGQFVVTSLSHDGTVNTRVWIPPAIRNEMHKVGQ